MREVELKARVVDYLSLKEKIEALYGEGKTVNKSDQYFHLPGNKHQALRMRNNKGVLEFTAKKTSNDSLSEDNMEYEFFASIEEYDRAFNFFVCLGYEPYFRKNKTGWEWSVGDIHVELLEVSGKSNLKPQEENTIGYFLEMEILIPFNQKNIDLRDDMNQLHNLLYRFGLKDDDIVMASYRSMILGE